MQYDKILAAFVDETNQNMTQVEIPIHGATSEFSNV